ncbi:MAG: adenylate/guanylate cyclase domain-containing protein [Armatimonadetes bacterium]|nr:adenylate/guanylate cyclase domain-containing protein [Armatimonadota bacterium]
MTDSERNLYLRRLRFPDDLERPFQSGYYTRYRRTLRFLSLLFCALACLFIVRDLFREIEYARILIGFGIPILLFLALFALTFLRGFERYWQPYFVLASVLVMPLILSVNAQHIRESEFYITDKARMSNFLAVLLVYVVAFSVIRLQFLWATLMYMAFIGAGIWIGGTCLQASAEVMWDFCQLAFVVQLALMLTALVQERLHRDAFLANHLLDLERAKSERLLMNVLPAAIAARLKDSVEIIADDHPEVTVLFADVSDFTPFAANRPAREVLHYLNEIFSRFDRRVEEHGLEKIKTVGDCYMAIAGAPTPRADHLEATVRLALEMREETERLSREWGFPVRCKIGLHAGPLVAGVIGEKRFLYDVWGDTVNTASRLETHGVAGKIQVSRDVAERLAGTFTVTRRGIIEVKGKGELETYFLEGEIAPPSPETQEKEAAASLS